MENHLSAAQKNNMAVNIPAMHKHYIGAAHSFEIVNTDKDTPDVVLLRTFFINDKVNKNDWRASWEGLKEDAKELPGTPLVLQEDLEHPNFSVQQYFDRGTIEDYIIDEEKHQIIVIVRITDPTIIERIKSGELQYVSPAVIPRGSEYLKKVGGVDILTRTLPVHLAIVENPAYGMEDAKMTHLCSGDGNECLHRLRIMTAATATKIYNSASECVSKKIQILKHERPAISNEQAAAIAYSMCKEGKESSSIESLEQIPYLKKMIASIKFMASDFERTVNNDTFHKLEGIEGRWITAKGMNVFIARHQSIDTAVMEQCGCNKLEL